MITFKQIEALYWANKLGTHAAAAERLHTTQSAVSKRIAELEEFLGATLFDRSGRTMQLTAKGREVLELGEEILQLRDRLLERMGKPVDVVRRYRIGVTELIGLTWLPKLVQEMREKYPIVSIEPEIDLSTALTAKLQRAEIDLAIIPLTATGPGFTAVPLETMALQWMCSPSLVETSHTLALSEIAQHPILMQIDTSGVDAVFDRWFQAKGLSIRRMYAGNSLNALSALTVAGFGVSYLPDLYFDDLVQQGLLKRVPVDEPLPTVRYYAVYRNDGPVEFNADIAALAQRLCDFHKPRYLPAPSPSALSPD
ncbi:LysR family transcriptional regulator [Pandoraea sp. NPDC087047]|uniref:LysR family transcriptional regulator n=1 Tax=Pandoraea sp. NPDC087047 TaxID=3364390 RepID=UPI00382C38E0